MRREAIRQLEGVIEGFKVVGYWQSIIYGLVNEPLEAVEAARKSLPKNTPILRIIPIDDAVKPYIDAVKRSVHRLLSKWPEGAVAVRIDGYIMDESGRIMHRRDAAIAIMEGVERPVNLKNPDVLIYIKVTRLGRGRVAAIYVGPPRGILSVVKEARQA